ncbi:MAG: hypothetical protein KDC33_12720, partial [Thermoleophilia bacterium]|nr:hypothetical protein [Thermoleophilia bacterium]
SARPRPGLRNRVLAWGAIAAGVAASAVVVSTGGGARPSAFVATAARPLPAGTVIAPGDLRATPVPAGWDAGGVVADPSRLVGGRTLGPIAEGDLVTRSMAPADAVAPLAAGQRAVPVPLTAAGGSAAMLVPGTRVDVVAARGDRPGGSTRVVVWDAEVLAVPPAAPDGYADPAAAVLLRATPREALRLTGALNFAQDVRLVVRSAAPRSGVGR